MSKSLQKKKIDNFYDLIDEIKNVVAERKFNAGMELVQMKHEVGQMIADNSLYKEYGEGSGKFIKRVSEELGTSERDVYYCVQFYKEYPVFETAFQKLDPQSKGLAWRNVVKALGGGGEECEHSELFDDVWTITRSKCRSCGKIQSEKREKQA